MKKLNSCKLSEYCEGCRTYNRFDNRCTEIPTSKRNKNGECPCSICIIKMVCTTVCSEYHASLLIAQSKYYPRLCQVIEEAKKDDKGYEIS